MAKRSISISDLDVQFYVGIKFYLLDICIYSVLQNVYLNCGMYSTFTSRNRDLAEKLSRKLELNSVQERVEPEPTALDYKYK